MKNKYKIINKKYYHIFYIICVYIFSVIQHFILFITFMLRVDIFR